MPPKASRPSKIKLAPAQRWMQAVIRHSGTGEEAIRSRPAVREIPASRMPVLPSATMTALERLDVYREMYWLRLREALENDYSELRKYLGEDAFNELCDAYVQRYPSRSYTLNRLGDHLPRFLASRGAASLKLKRREFLADLARLELLMTEVFDDAEVPVITEQQVARVPAEAWETMRLKPIVALRLGEFRYPVSAYASAIRDEKPAAHLQNRKDSWVLVFRRAYQVHRLELTKPAFRVFQALAKGKPLGEAVGASRVSPTEIRDWFTTWVANRVFQSISKDQLPRGDN